MIPRPHRSWIGVSLALTLLCVLCRGESVGPRARDLAPIALAADAVGQRLYVACAADQSIACLDLKPLSVRKWIDLPLAPTGLAITPDASLLIVTAQGDQGCVLFVDPVSGTIRRRVAVGHTPLSPVLSPDGRTLYVCNRFDDSVSVVDLAIFQERCRLAVTREPIAAAVTPDGRTLWVANHLPEGPANAPVVAAVVEGIDTATHRVIASILLPNGSTGVRGLCISPDGRWAYVTHTLGRYDLPTTQLDRGWMNTNTLSILDLTKRCLYDSVLLDDIDHGAANPWGVTCSAQGQWLYVAQAGTHEVSIIDRLALHRKLEQRQASASASRPAASYDLTFLQGIRQRVALGGNGPRGILAVDSQLFVAEYFSDRIVALTPRAANSAQVHSVALGSPHTPSQARLGEQYFNDAQFCYQQWQSCASCHPDGRADGLNWDLVNDGVGNPKQTKSLLLSHRTPPAMLSGVRGKAEDAVRSGLRRIQFVERPESDAQAIDAYCRSLTPVPAPVLSNPALRQKIALGRQVFEKADCAHCHPAPLYTDLASYDVGTGVGKDAHRPFDTPTLVEVWRTRPYLSIGQAKTMLEVIEKNPGDAHGKTSNLTPEEKEALVAFILSR